MPAGTFKDSANNNFTGISNNSTISFLSLRRKIDSQPPITTVSDVSPQPGAVDVPTNSNIVIRLDRNVTKGTGNILLINTTTGETIVSINVNSDNVQINKNNSLSKISLE